VGVEFGTATLWSGSDRQLNGGSSFDPDGVLEYQWDVPWSIGRSEFALPAGVGQSKVLTMSWNSQIGSIESPDTIAVFVNDQLGTTCDVKQAFIYSP
jgi:hypothetical protein